MQFVILVSTRCLFIIQLPISLLIIIDTYTIAQSSSNYILISIFCPFSRHSLRRPYLAENEVCQSGDNESPEKVETVNIGSTDRDSLTHCTSKSDDIDDDTENIRDLRLMWEGRVGYVSLWIEAAKIPVWSISIRGVQIRN
jgi:hypothetical protein